MHLIVEIATRISGVQNPQSLREALIEAVGEPKVDNGFSGETLVWESAKMKSALKSFLTNASAAVYTNKEVTGKIVDGISGELKMGPLKECFH